MPMKDKSKSCEAQPRFQFCSSCHFPSHTFLVKEGIFLMRIPLRIQVLDICTLLVLFFVFLGEIKTKATDETDSQKIEETPPSIGSVYFVTIKQNC